MPQTWGGRRGTRGSSDCARLGTAVSGMAEVRANARARMALTDSRAQEQHNSLCTAGKASLRSTQSTYMLSHHDRPRLKSSRVPGVRPSGPSRQRGPILEARRKGVQGRKASILQHPRR